MTRQANSTILPLPLLLLFLSVIPERDINFHEIASKFGHAVQGLAPEHAGLHVVHAKH